MSFNDFFHRVFQTTSQISFVASAAHKLPYKFHYRLGAQYQLHISMMFETTYKTMKMNKKNFKQFRMKGNEYDHEPCS